MTDPVRDSFEALRREQEVTRQKEAERELSQTVAKINEVDERWTDEAVKSALSPIIADVIRESGRDEPEALSRSLAPHIVTTVRAEIKNSENEIIDVLHPRLGRLIKQAVDTAVKDLQEQVDNALPIDRWVAQITSRLTGAPALGTLLDDPDPFVIYEAMLIERGSGELIAHERPGLDPDIESSEGEIDGDLLSSMIAAIDSFAKESLADATGGGLRRIETEAGSIVMRASATRILALRASGDPSPEAEERLDLLLDSILENDSADGPILPPRPLLTEDAPAAGGVSAFGILGAGIGGILSILGLIWAHYAIEGARVARAEDQIISTAQQVAGMKSYPIRTEFKDSEIIVSGIAPDATALADVKQAIDQLPPTYKRRNEMVIAGKRLAE